MDSPASIDTFAQRFLLSGRLLHLLINNAGIMATPLVRDARGFESQLATNYLGYSPHGAALAGAVPRQLSAGGIPLFPRSRPPGSGLRGCALRETSLRQMGGLWAVENRQRALRTGPRRSGEAHQGRAFSIHPGAVLTELSRSVPDEEIRALRATVVAQGSVKTTEQGAANTLWCAVSPELDGRGGVYCEDVDIAQAVPAEFTEPRGVRPWAMDPEFAERLWSLSETWTGVPFST